MIVRAVWPLLAVVLLVAPAAEQDKKFTIKTATTAAPNELNESIRKLLANESVQFFDGEGARIAEFWFCKEIPSDATPEQFKNGVTYRELKESQIIGAARFDQPYEDYRKQKIKAGVYSLRLGFQPANGDHLGKSEYTEFALICPAARDTKTDLMSHKNLSDLSSKTSDTGHAVVLMLFPNAMPGKTQIESKARDHWVIYTSCTVKAGDQRGTLGFGLNVVGEADD